MMNTNTSVPLILRTDSYKLSHYEQLAEGLEYSHVYLESRYGVDESMFFGLQYILKTYLTQRITHEMIDVCEQFANLHGLSFNRKGWEYIVKKHKGKLPLRISALREGTIVPTRTPMMVITNTDPELAWLPMYFEALLQRIWYSITVASYSFEQRKVIKGAAELTVDDIDAYVMYALHDFGARGASVAEAAEVGCMSHLVSFQGSDTLEGIWTAQMTYGCKSGMPAFSVAAIEHNVVLTWGEENEKSLFQSLIHKYVAAGKFISILCDTYDTDRALEYWSELKDELIAAWEHGGKTGRVIVRPDSGHAVNMPVHVVIKLLDIFGYTINSKGYKVLPSYIRVIQGDGTSKEVIQEILDKLASLSISAENIVFGQGGKLLQAHGRDDRGFAMKNSMAVIDGELVPTSKRPKTDPAKRSKEGYFVVRFEGGEVVYDEVTDRVPADFGMLEPVFENGEILRTQSFDNVRSIANGYLDRPFPVDKQVVGDSLNLVSCM